VVFVPVILSTGSATALPTPESLDTPLAPTPVAIPLPAQPLQTIVTPFTLVSTATAGTQSESRYYELRIVTLNEDGQDEEREDYQIRLSDEATAQSETPQQTGSLYPFHPGKLRELFRRLPDDHYRLYLIEDEAERLILDFTIQQGRPIEVQEVDWSIDQPNVTPLPEDDTSPPLDGESQPDDATPNAGVMLPANMFDDSTVEVPDSSPRQTDHPLTFAERMGRTEFVSQGGIVLTAAALKQASPGRRDAMADRLMARFGRRRPSTPRNCAIQ
jgi:hypothetical protein